MICGNGETQNPKFQTTFLNIHHVRISQCNIKGLNECKLFYTSLKGEKRSSSKYNLGILKLL